MNWPTPSTITMHLHSGSILTRFFQTVNGYRKKQWVHTAKYPIGLGNVSDRAADER